jgi:ssRNA-specific RNase YbeY (16S rRNA maturation enzyme)
MPYPQNIETALEVEKMIIHGLVHLKGFDHERGKEAQFIMKSLENNIKKLTSPLCH